MFIKPVYNTPDGAPSGDAAPVDSGAPAGAPAADPNPPTPAENFVVEAMEQMSHLRGGNFDAMDDIDLPPVGDGGVQGFEPGQPSQQEQFQRGNEPAPPAEQPEWPRVTPQAHQPVVQPQRVQQQPQAPVQQPGQQPLQPQVQGQPQQQQPDPNAQQQQQPPQREAPPVDPFAFHAELIAQQRDGFQNALSEQVYRVSDEDVQKLLEPGGGKIISQHLAAVQVNAVESVMRVLTQQMPVWVNGLLQMRQRYGEREETFWSRNPHLDRKAHKSFVAPIARTYIQSVPNATEEQVDRMVGMLVAAAAGVPFTGQAPQQGQPQRGQPQRGNGLPPVRTPGPVVRSVQPAAYAPAGVNGAGQQPGQPQAPQNQWAQLTEAFLLDDAGYFDNNQG